MSRLVLIGSGKDRVGLVKDITGVIFEEDGGILDSKMSRVGGNFTMLFLIEIPSNNVKDFRDLVTERQEALGLTLYCEEA